MPIRFHNADVSFSLKRKNALKKFIEKQLSKAAKRVELSYVFCSDEFLLNINLQFLKHDYYTDIITFPLTSTKDLLDAEIYISIDRVKENATVLDVRLADELLRVMFHGALHLVGFKDKSRTDKVNMRNAEDRWLNKYHLSK